VLRLLSEEGVTVRWIEGGEDGAKGRLISWFRTLNVPNLSRLEASARDRWGERFRLRRELGTVTVVGTGIGERPALLARVLEAIADIPVAPVGCHQSAYGVTLLLPLELLDPCQRVLHTLFLEDSARSGV